ncbi:TadE/TadG family type IV pilus assembly protein [Sphingomonas sp. ASV193]|uniref:TadE/TadG family type IV pilus assembly protein n=1 Tax=Sphingomonas sp. ASV193 TaxID=3144405 RepID=UPI0032E90467
MTASRASIRRDGGNAAAEMALLVPLLVILGMGSIEVGNYFLSEHKLVQSVRDATRYIARQDFSNFNTCTASWSAVPNNTLADGTKIVDNTKAIVKQPALNWTGTGMTIDVEMMCDSATGSLGGIYNNTGGVARLVRVTAHVPYASSAAYGLGVNFNGYFMNASEQAAVTGV